MPWSDIARWVASVAAWLVAFALLVLLIMLPAVAGRKGK